MTPIGFEYQKPLHWLRSNDAPIRQVFCLRQWKGGAIAPAWGLSLDFVPHLSGSAVKWHRTAKSAQLDLTVDARDQNLDISYVQGVDAISEQAPRVVREAVLRASDFWAKTRSIPELPAAFEWTKSYLSKGGLGFYNYVQHPIAYAFTLALNGQHTLARAELDRFLVSSRASESIRERLGVLLGTAGAT